MNALEVLGIMRDTVSARVVHELNHAMALRLDSQSHIGGFERYTINETGRKLLEGR